MKVAIGAMLLLGLFQFCYERASKTMPTAPLMVIVNLLMLASVPFQLGAFWNLARTRGEAIVWQWSTIGWLGVGVVAAIAQTSLLLIGLRNSSIALVTGMCAASPVVAMLLSWAVTNARPSVKDWVGAFVVATGVTILAWGKG
jgi:drug/metabolite transporter (DMT)-like permease